MKTQRLHTLIGHTLHAEDGKVGTVHDFYLTDDAWRVTYVVISTGSFFSERRLVFPPQLLAFDSFHPEVLRVKRTRDQILASPDWDAEKPVHRQKEEEIGRDFLWLPAGSLNNIVFRPLGAPDDTLAVDEHAARRAGENPHLRSLREIRGYEVTDINGDSVGHLVDAVTDREHWTVPFVTIKTHGDPDGTLLSVHHIDHIDWARARARVELDSGQLTSLHLDQQALISQALAR